MASDDLGLVHPSAQAVEAVCHDEQMTVWVDEIAGDLSMGGYLRDDLTYDEALAAGATISHALRRIIGAAFTHPELAALSAEGSATIAAARKQAAEEIRERAARIASSMEHSLDGQGRIGCVSCANKIAVAIRSLPPSSSPEDQQKAAATPTIADPDGEARS